MGAGSAGCVLANRLSELENSTVLLIEAGGPDDKPEIHVPLGYLALQKSEVDWNRSTAVVFWSPMSLVGLVVKCWYHQCHGVHQRQ